VHYVVNDGHTVGAAISRPRICTDEKRACCKMQETEKKKVAYVGEGLAPPAHANVLIHKKCTAQSQKAAITPFYIRKNNMVLLGGASPSPTAKPSFVQAKLYFATAPYGYRIGFYRKTASTNNRKRGICGVV